MILRPPLIAGFSALLAIAVTIAVMLVWANEKEGDSRAEGYENGLIAGDQAGYERGYEAGRYDGHESVFDQGYQLGYTVGTHDAYEIESLGGFLADIRISGPDLIEFNRAECALHVYSDEERQQTGSHVLIGCY